MTPHERYELLQNAHLANQALAKANGDNAARVQSWGMATWAALIAFAHTSISTFVPLIGSIFVLVSCLLLDMGYRQVQYSFIERSLELERDINRYLVTGKLEIPDFGVSTQINTPSIKSALALFSVKRWLFWFPYLLLLSGSIALLAV